MKNFAHWTSTIANPGLADAEHFIVDIPDGTSREDVIAKLSLEYDVDIGESDGLEFQEKWPREIQQEFNESDESDETSGVILHWGGH